MPYREPTPGRTRARRCLSASPAGAATAAQGCRVIRGRRARRHLRRAVGKVRGPRHRQGGGGSRHRRGWAPTVCSRCVWRRRRPIAPGCPPGCTTATNRACPRSRALPQPCSCREWSTVRQPWRLRRRRRQCLRVSPGCGLTCTAGLNGGARTHWAVRAAEAPTAGRWKVWHWGLSPVGVQATRSVQDRRIGWGDAFKANRGARVGILRYNEDELRRMFCHG